MMMKYNLKSLINHVMLDKMYGNISKFKTGDLSEHSSPSCATSARTRTGTLVFHFSDDARLYKYLK